LYLKKQMIIGKLLDICLTKQNNFFLETRNS
jgi:hypothetical protein